MYFGKTDTVRLAECRRILRSRLELNQYLTPRVCFSPACNASYAASINHAPYEVWLISQKSNQQFRQALRAIDNELLAEVMNRTVA